MSGWLGRAAVGELGGGRRASARATRLARESEVRIPYAPSVTAWPSRFGLTVRVSRVGRAANVRCVRAPVRASNLALERLAAGGDSADHDLPNPRIKLKTRAVALSSPAGNDHTNGVRETIINAVSSSPREVREFPVGYGLALVSEINSFLVDGVEIAITTESLPRCDSNQPTRLVEKEFDRSIGYAMGFGGVKRIDLLEKIAQGGDRNMERPKGPCPKERLACGLWSRSALP
jgi:hypothetical protein